MRDFMLFMLMRSNRAKQNRYTHSRKSLTKRKYPPFFPLPVIKLYKCTSAFYVVNLGWTDFIIFFFFLVSVIVRHQSYFGLFRLSNYYSRQHVLLKWSKSCNQKLTNLLSLRQVQNVSAKVDAESMIYVICIILILSIIYACIYFLILFDGNFGADRSTNVLTR